MIEVSIIIVTYGQWPVTERCLRSLETVLEGKLGHTWEIVVVDNNSADETPTCLRQWADRVRVDLLPENRNFAGGCNRGAELAQGQVLLFLNNDTEVPPGALETLAEQALESGIGAAGCRLVHPDRTLQHVGITFIQGEAFGGAAMPQHVLIHHDGTLSAGAAIFEADSVTAACIAIRRSAFESVDGFDTLYRNGLEDIDLCLKLRMAGHRVVYRGDVSIVHYEGASRGAGRELLMTPERLAAMHDNDARFVSRWAARLGADDELALQVWDGELRDQSPERMGGAASDTVLLGQPSGIGSAADEARAMIRLLVEKGEIPAAFDMPRTNLVARLEAQMAGVLQMALTVSGQADGRFLLVPEGPIDTLLAIRQDVLEHPRTRLRLATTETRMPVALVPRILAASEAVATALLSDGLPASNVTVCPPPVAGHDVGPGGGGVLAILPVQSTPLAARVILALRSLPTSIPLRCLPTVFSRNLAADLAAELPHAELLAVCSDEDRFAALAASADVLVAADPSDYYERRGLVAAAVGTSPVMLEQSGSVLDVLGTDHIATDATLVSTLQAHLEGLKPRSELSDRVRHACDPRLLDQLMQ